MMGRLQKWEFLAPIFESMLVCETPPGIKKFGSRI
ncbi:hypothetical protein BH18VER1_BH18VER1_04530 [soil metagenome]